MTCLLFYIFAAIFLVSAMAADDGCGPNERANTEPSTCGNDCCPSNEGEPTACSSDCSYKPCVCGLHYRRAVNGTCIWSRNCPPINCPEHEEFDPCPVCSEDCSNKSEDGRRCRFRGKIGVTVICDPKCRCKENYWRNNGTCVPYIECPDPELGKE